MSGTVIEMPTNLLQRGNDQHRATCRGSLQSRRSQLNREIHREMRLRAGAENLLRASNNRVVKETVTLELSFVNSHLQLLREQLAELNGCLEAYQGQGQDTSLPMIPLGLKETRDIDFREPFKDFILEHYSEDGSNFDDSIKSFMELRQAMRRPSRTKSGVQLLLRYLGVLYYVERRFFPSDRNIGVFFEWYDALTGVPSVQRTVAFEKASVLFNLAALHTQIGARQDRQINSDSADAAVDNFLRAAGTLRYIGEHFTHPPSFDLSAHTLESLTALLLVQARECLFEKQQTIDKIDSNKIIENGIQNDEQSKLIELAQEAQLLSDDYTRVSERFNHEELKEFIPPAWFSLVQVKKELYKCVANHYLSTLLLSECKFSEETYDSFKYLYCETDNQAATDIRIPSNDEEKRILGFCHLRQALSSLEDSSRYARLNRELRSKAGLQTALSALKDRILATLQRKEIHSEEELEHYLDPPRIMAATKFQLELSPPDLSTHSVEDPFKGLGPLSMFSARRHWSAPRSINLRRRGESGFGVSVKGSTPVQIANVDENSPAEMGGIRTGDVIVGICGKDAKWKSHDEVVELVRNAGESLALRLVTPMDTKSSSHSGSHRSGSKGRLSPHSTSSSASLTTPRSSSGSSSSGSMGRRSCSISPPGTDSTVKKLTTLFRRSKSRDKNSSSPASDMYNYKSNVILR